MQILNFNVCGRTENTLIYIIKNVLNYFEEISDVCKAVLSMTV